MSATPLSDRLASVRLRGGLRVDGDVFAGIVTRSSMVGPDVAIAEYVASMAPAWGAPWDAVRESLRVAVGVSLEGKGVTV